MPTSIRETNKLIVIAKRKAVKELKSKHFTKTQIQKKLAVTPHFVRKWWNVKDVEEDHRGWPKGQPRIYSQAEENRVVDIRQKLLAEDAIFFGPDAILQGHIEKFPKLDLPSRSFVIRTLKEHGLSKSYRKRVKGGSVYQHYPAQSILNLGQVVQEADFTGRKTLKGYPNPLHFWARVYLKPFKLPQVTRVVSPSGQVAASELISDWQQYPLPDVLKLDNDTAYYASGRYSKQWISRFICWLLNLGISPVFSAFNKPWNNGSVEGINSVFVKKIWVERHHETLTKLDQTITRFNCEYASRISKEYESGLPVDYKVDLKKVKLESDLVRPTIYFTRQVKSICEQACINVLKVLIKLPESYLKQFVLAKLDVYQEQLTIYYETEYGRLRTIKSLKFPIKYH